MMEEIKPKKERKFLKAMGDIALTLFRELVLGIGKKVINKVGNKRQGLVIAFVILASTFAIAQFPNTGNKQRLGFQTTGDGLVWRGALSDTASIQPVNNQNAWVILDTINLKFYTFDFTSNVWNLVGGGGLTMPFDSITFNTAKNGTVGVGEVEYNDTQGSLIQGLKGGNVTNVIGQQLHQRVNNRTGAPLAKGDVVYLSGSQGNRITVAKALATSDPTSANTFGIVAESIADNASGYVITEGLITGLNTSALTQDSAVYLSGTTAGALTSTKPQAPIHGVYIGVCVKSNAGSGELFCKIRNGQELDELHDVQITSPVDKASLYYKSSDGLWRDTTAALLVSDTASMLTPYFRDADTTSLNLTSRFAAKLNLSDTTNMLLPYLRKADTTNMLLPYLRDADTVTLSNRINLKLNIADTSAFARDNQISGTSGQVAYFNSSSSVVSDTALRWSAANKSLGINMTTTPSGANLIIKNSQDPVRTTVVATQTFGADTTNWTRGAGWTFNGTAAVATSATGALTYSAPLTLTTNNGYQITYTITNYIAGTITVAVGAQTLSLPTYNITENNVMVVPTTSVVGGFRFTTSNFTGNLDNISVVEISKPSPIIFAGQDEVATNLYNPLRMPNSTTIGFGGGGRFTTSINNVFLGTNAGVSTTTGGNNNFFGANAGDNNTTGASNNFFGGGSGRRNTTGNSNNFFGNEAGAFNTQGYNNNFFGFNSGYGNTIGFSNNFFGTNAGRTNTTGNYNNAFGENAGRNLTSGYQNNFFGISAGQNTTSGFDNDFIGANSGFRNTTGFSNVFIGGNSGYQITSGDYNTAIGPEAMGTLAIADTLTGNNNIAIGRNAADNIRATAAANVAIGNQVDLPTNNGSNQGVYQNVLFFTGASGTGTTIAAASKAGIKTNAPNRDLEVAGEVRITDLTTDAPTRLVGADADGDLGQVTLGAGLSLASSSLLADTNFLVTRFDTASMLTPYFKGDTISLSNRINAKLNLSDTLNMLVPYLRKADTTNMLLPYFRDADTTQLNLTSRFNTKQNTLNGTGFVKASGTNITYDNSSYLRTGLADSTYLKLTGGTLTGGLTGTTGAFTSNLTIGNILSNEVKSISAYGLNNGTLVTSSGGSSLILYNLSGNINTFSTLSFYNKTSNGTIYPAAQIRGIKSSDQTSVLSGSLSFDLVDTTGNYQERLRLTNIGNFGIGTNTPSYKLDVNGTFNASGNSLIGGTLNVTSNITGNSFIKSGGTSSQFLKADGSVDNNAYLTTSSAISTYLPLTGGTLTGGLTGTTALFSSNVAIGFPFAYKPFEVLSNANDFVSVGVRELAKFQYSGIHFGYRQENVNYRKSAIVFQRNEGYTLDASGRLHILNVNEGEGSRSADLRDAKITISNNGGVGINDTTPLFTLDVNGTLGVTGATTLSAPLTVNSSAVFNEGSADADFRVESDGNANMVFVDASTDRVGIGTNSPTKTLDVNGELNVLSAGTFGGRLNTNWMERTYSNSTSTSLTVSVNTTWLKLENNSTITLTLPNAATYPGKELHIKNAGTGAVNSLSSNIEPLNSTTIGTAILASGGGKWATLVSDGTYWVIMAGN